MATKPSKKLKSVPKREPSSGEIALLELGLKAAQQSLYDAHSRREDQLNDTANDEKVIEQKFTAAVDAAIRDGVRRVRVAYDELLKPSNLNIPPTPGTIPVTPFGS